jgi:hypothetical protein
MSAEELNTFREAEQEAPWRAAMAEEMRAIHENNTWELASLPTRHRAIGLKWVYKVRPARSCGTRRLVAKGYVQRTGIDFNEVFAPVT